MWEFNMRIPSKLPSGKVVLQFKIARDFYSVRCMAWFSPTLEENRSLTMFLYAVQPSRNLMFNQLAARLVRRDASEAMLADISFHRGVAGTIEPRATVVLFFGKISQGKGPSHHSIGRRCCPRRKTCTLSMQDF